MTSWGDTARRLHHTPGRGQLWAPAHMARVLPVVQPPQDPGQQADPRRSGMAEGGRGPAFRSVRLPIGNDEHRCPYREQLRQGHTASCNVLQKNLRHEDLSPQEPRRCFIHSFSIRSPGAVGAGTGIRRRAGSTPSPPTTSSWVATCPIRRRQPGAWQ